MPSGSGSERDPDDRRARVGDALREVQHRIVRAADAAGRDPATVTLVAVTKTFPASDIAVLASLGVDDVGESRDQEARAKQAELHGPTGPVDSLRWHFIGRLQRNKAASVGRWAQVVHSVDREAVLTGLARGAGEAGRVADVFVQVSLDDDTDRGGVRVADVPALAGAVAATDGLRLIGVMSVPPQNADPDRAFAHLAQISAALQGVHPDAAAMSAGMSGDFEAAIRHGATHVRVGSALLGSRPPILS